MSLQVRYLAPVEPPPCAFFPTPRPVPSPSPAAPRRWRVGPATQRYTYETPTHHAEVRSQLPISRIIASRRWRVVRGILLSLSFRHPTVHENIPKPLASPRRGGRGRGCCNSDYLRPSFL